MRNQSLNGLRRTDHMEHSLELKGDLCSGDGLVLGVRPEQGEEGVYVEWLPHARYQNPSSVRHVCTFGGGPAMEVRV